MSVINKILITTVIMFKNLSRYLIPLFDAIDNALNDKKENVLAKIHPTNDQNYFYQGSDDYIINIDLECMDDGTVNCLNKARFCFLQNRDSVNFNNFYYKSVEDFFNRCPV